MATVSVNPVEEKQKGKSALENFATAMGIMSNLASLGMGAYNTFNPAATAANTTFENFLKGQATKPGTDLLISPDVMETYNAFNR